MCAGSEIDAENLFDVPILYGPGKSESNDGNLIDVPRWQSKKCDILMLWSKKIHLCYSLWEHTNTF